MPHFAYTGRVQNGESVQGVFDAESAAACASHLVRSGITPVSIRESDHAERRGATAGPGLFAPAIRPIDVQLFSRQLYTLMRAGVPILRALGGLVESSSNVSFARVIQSLKTAIETGRDLSAAMRQHPQVFSPF